MALNSAWSILEESFDILGDYGYPAMDRLAAGLALEPGWFTCVAAIWLFGSEPFATAEFMRMFPYGLARLNEERFASARRQGFLISTRGRHYLPSEDGARLAQSMWRAAGDSLADLHPVPEELLHRLFGYLDRLIEASLSAPEPPAPFYISHKHENYGRYGTKYPLEDFVVRFGALAAYRDDSHNAAWQVHQVEGHAWELLTYLWRSASAASMEQLLEKAAYRGIPVEIYIRDLQVMTTKGWIGEASGEYQLTAEGKRIRDEAEALTDRYFFAPWACLSESNLEELAHLARQLRDGLKRTDEK